MICYFKCVDFSLALEQFDGIVFSIEIPKLCCLCSPYIHQLLIALKTSIDMKFLRLVSTIALAIPLALCQLLLFCLNQLENFHI